MSIPNILVVEDENLVAMDLQARLEELGFQVTDTVASGEEAVLTIQKSHPDAILMDIKLRGHLDGIETVQQIRNLIDVPVIYLTAYSDETLLQRAKLTGPHAYLIKPFVNRELKMAIDLALVRHASEKEREGTCQRLEQQVAERTSELLSANSTLSRHLKEIQQAKEQALRQNVLLDAINQVFYRAYSCVNEEELWHTCMKLAQELTGSRVSLIGEFKETGRFDTIAVSDTGWEACRIPTSEATCLLKNMEILDCVLKTGQSLLVNELTALPEVAAVPTNYLPITSFLGVPLKEAGGRVMGMIALANKEGGYEAADQREVEHLSVALVEALQRLRSEAALRESEEKYRGLIEITNTGYLIVDTEGKVLDANQEYVRLTGYNEIKEILGRNTIEWTAEQDHGKNAAAIEHCLKTGIVKYLELDYAGRDGRSIPVEINATAISTAEGVKLLSLVRDISDRKRVEDEKAKLEAQLVQAQKMEAIGTLAGGIAHDFNNILTAILGNIGLAALDDKIGPRVKGRLAQAEAACLRAEALSRQLLTFAKGGAPIKKLVSVAELLGESTVFASVGSSVKCETFFPENLWSIEADPGQIAQIFQNLTINAIQAMPTGGTIKVWAENLTLGAESGLPLSAGRYVKISVRDQGMGIPAEHLPRIFDPYFTTKQKGSGLGLASAYAIIEKHHGHIAVESKPGIGTTFHIYLPAEDQQVTPHPKEDMELLVGKGKILVMDDEEMVREVLGRLLARLGYQAEFTKDGGEAIKMFVQAHGSGQAFAAVILDLTVPGAMGGKETLARLLEIDPQVKAIVSSGYSDDPIMADFQKYGFSGVIAKPYRISELGKILHEVVMGKP